MSFEPSGKDYLDLAREMNKVAGNVLRLNTRDASAIEAKISIGLSLQAAELAGKGMLLCLGMSASEIKRVHKNHDLLMLLRSVEEELKSSKREPFQSHWDFLMWAPTIDGTKFGMTIDHYLEEHFSAGASAYPRSYFYPDEKVFTGPVPIQAVFVMVEHLIDTLRILVGENP